MVSRRDAYSNPDTIRKVILTPACSPTSFGARPLFSKEDFSIVVGFIVNVLLLVIMTSPVTFSATAYVPTSARTGNDAPYLFRLVNMIVRGGLGKGSPYLACYEGSLDLNEPIPSLALTGTLDLTEDSAVIEGTGTSFKTELHLGQKILVIDTVGHASYPLTVSSITDDEEFIATENQPVSLTGKTGYRMPVMFPLDTYRGTQTWGNAVQFDQGGIQGVGDGELLRNGQSLPGDSMTYADKKPLLAIYDASMNTYTVVALGMDSPTSAPTVTSVSGGTLGQLEGDYGIVLVPARTSTGGFNNGSPPGRQSLVTGDLFEVTDPGFDTTHEQDAWHIYVTLYYSAGVDTTNSPMFFLKEVTAADIAGGKFQAEWLDRMLDGALLLTFDNLPPPDSERIAVLAGVPVYVSCLGSGNTSPGPVLVSTKPYNPEAAPVGRPPFGNSVPLSPPRTILGCVEGQGRLYLLTMDSLPIAQSINDQPYILTRPFWKTGFTNPYQLIFINGRLYGDPHAGPTRSIADGDEGSEEQDFAADVQELIVNYRSGASIVQHDPKNNAVCYFYPAYNLNSDGYWTTRVLMFGSSQNNWIGDVLLTSDSQDMIVCGAATVKEHLDFLAGGRNSMDSMVVGTYRFDAQSGETVPWSITWTFTDSGAEERPKWIRSVRATAKTTDAGLGIFGSQSSQPIPVNLLAQGPSVSSSGEIPLTNTTEVTPSMRVTMSLPFQRQWAVQIAGEWNGEGDPDRVDEVVVEASISGARI
jgi:hypothetical protein